MRRTVQLLYGIVFMYSVLRLPCVVPCVYTDRRLIKDRPLLPLRSLRPDPFVPCTSQQLCAYITLTRTRHYTLPIHSARGCVRTRYRAWHPAASDHAIANQTLDRNRNRTETTLAPAAKRHRHRAHAPPAPARYSVPEVHIWHTPIKHTRTHTHVRPRAKSERAVALYPAHCTRHSTMHSDGTRHAPTRRSIPTQAPGSRDNPHTREEHNTKQLTASRTGQGNTHPKAARGACRNIKKTHECWLRVPLRAGKLRTPAFERPAQNARRAPDLTPP